jgi:hypothetical protein
MAFRLKKKKKRMAFYMYYIEYRTYQIMGLDLLHYGFILCHVYVHALNKIDGSATRLQMFCAHRK